MDEASPRVYEDAGRTPGPNFGSARRGAGRCVSRPISARPRNRFSGGLGQGRILQMASIDSLKTRRELTAGGKTYHYYSLPAAEEAGLSGVSQLPVSLKVLLENQLRFEDDISVGADDLKAFAAWVDNKGAAEHEISFRPARVLMQDFTGVPAVVDLAAMRDALAKLGADAAKINPLVPVDLVIDHSVMVDYFGAPTAFAKNVDREYERNLERYRFLRWGSSAFNNFRVVPP